MIFDHLGRRVGQTDDARCPDCEQSLFARRGDLVAWHWAHYPSETERACRDWTESNWHLAMKEAHASTGWQIEKSVAVDGRKFRFDAYALGRVREFVHSLSPAYEDKHDTLAGCGYKVDWIFDGVEFASEHRRLTRKEDGVVGLLKPRAAEIASRLSERGNVFVHLRGELFDEFGISFVRLWKRNVWFEREPIELHASLVGDQYEGWYDAYLQISTDRRPLAATVSPIRAGPSP